MGLYDIKTQRMEAFYRLDNFQSLKQAGLKIRLIREKTSSARARKMEVCFT